MYHYTKTDAVSALKSLGITAGDTLFIHSNIGYFGIPEGERSADNANKTLLAALLEVLGDNGTLVVPTFTYSFSNGQSFDPDNSLSDCGRFAEFIRMHPDSVRSTDPHVSVAALGKKAIQLTQNVSKNAYAEDSFFARFFQEGGKVCNFNFDTGSTLVHYIERLLNVPYRFDKAFTGTISSQGQEQEDCFTIYVRDTSTDATIADFTTLDKLAVEQNLYQKATLGRGFIGVISIRDKYQLIKNELQLNPHLLIKGEYCEK